MMDQSDHVMWKHIWEKKYASSGVIEDHVLDGFDALTPAQWEVMVAAFMRLVDVPPQSDVLEVGCGVGAFLKYVKHAKSLSGIDYSEGAIARIKSSLQGDFYVSEAARLPFLHQSFNAVICFSVFFYFPDLAYAQKVLCEMLRVLRPGGVLFVGEINDLAKLDVYHSLRSKESREVRAVVPGASTQHLFYETSFFESFAKAHGLTIDIFHENVMPLEFYSSAQYRFSVRMVRVLDG